MQVVFRDRATVRVRRPRRRRSQGRARAAARARRGAVARHQPSLRGVVRRRPWRVHGRIDRRGLPADGKRRLVAWSRGLRRADAQARAARRRDVRRRARAPVRARRLAARRVRSLAPGRQGGEGPLHRRVCLERRGVAAGERPEHAHQGRGRGATADGHRARACAVAGPGPDRRRSRSPADPQRELRQGVPRSRRGLVRRASRAGLRRRVRRRFVPRSGGGAWPTSPSRRSPRT